MSARQQNTAVGVFALVAIVVMTGLVMAFGGGRSLFSWTYNVSAYFPAGVQSVQPGQSVTLNGKRIGETREIRFRDDKDLSKGVVVVVEVEEYEIPANCEMIVSPNIMGLGKPPLEIRVIDAVTGKKLPTDGTAEIPGRMKPMLDQLIPPQTQDSLMLATKHIGELAAALRPLAENLGRLTEARTMQDVDMQKMSANLDTVIQRFDQVLKSFNAVIGDSTNQENFSTTLANARKMSESGAAAMDNIRNTTVHGEQLAKDLGSLLGKLAQATDQLSGMLKTMDQTLATLNDKKGTVGLLLNDNRLYEELLLSARRLSKLLDEARATFEKANKGELFKVF